MAFREFSGEIASTGFDERGAGAWPRRCRNPSHRSAHSVPTIPVAAPWLHHCCAAPRFVRSTSRNSDAAWDLLRRAAPVPLTPAEIIADIRPPPGRFPSSRDYLAVHLNTLRPTSMDPGSWGKRASVGRRPHLRVSLPLACLMPVEPVVRSCFANLPATPPQPLRSG